MDWWSLWLAAAPIAGTIVLLTPLSGRWRLRSRLPWVGAVLLLLIGSMMFTQCSARAVAVDQIERRLFPDAQSAIAIYDPYAAEWVQIAAGPAAEPSPEVRLLSAPVRARQEGNGHVGSARPLDMGVVRLQVKGSVADVSRLHKALELLASTRYGSAVLADVLMRDDVTVSLVDEIGIELPTGQLLTTGGTAMTRGKQVFISRSRYGYAQPEVLAAMIAHELTHVAQNTLSGTAWWQWPWTTVEREETAHLVQAIVWAELRGPLRDYEQDGNLESAMERDALRTSIRFNPAYPWWLAPDVSC